MAIKFVNMLISSIIGTAGALGSAIYGAVKSSKANNQARKLIDNQRKDNRRWYETKMNQDYTARADVQRAITKQRELLDEQMKRASATSRVAGASDEATALAKDSANRSLAEATADIAAAGANYKDNVEQQYRAQDAALNQQQAQSYQNQAAQTAAAASQGVNAGLGLVGAGISATSNPSSKALGAQKSATLNAQMQNLATDAASLPTMADVASAQQKIETPAAILSEEELAARRQIQKQNA